ncbi:MAG: glycyl-radical enzyme activating protein [Anaerostipes sp.]|jgi:pyruvate formate lyase activating enzyme
MEGNIFDIRRFSTHDGDGIRTTIFFKGCPLSCVWCQNPEGISITRRPLYFENRCINCGTCTTLCKHGGMEMKDGKLHINPEAEEKWEELIYHCPAGAIQMDSKTYSVEEVMEEIQKDKVFYKHGGGITLSGGEPLLQGEFAKELLKQCKKVGIHTAIETALHVKSEVLKGVLPYLDMAYADLKLINDKAHEKYTGTSNELIKKNIEILLSSNIKDKVVIRTPMIPEITTSKENIKGIAEFIAGIDPEVSYEILNYNPLAQAKYHLVNQEYCFDENPKLYSKEKMKEFGEWAKEAGVKHVIIES